MSSTFAIVHVGMLAGAEAGEGLLLRALPPQKPRGRPPGWPRVELALVCKASKSPYPIARTLQNSSNSFTKTSFAHK